MTKNCKEKLLGLKFLTFFYIRIFFFFCSPFSVFLGFGALGLRWFWEGVRWFWESFYLFSLSDGRGSADFWWGLSVHLRRVLHFFLFFLLCFLFVGLGFGGGWWILRVLVRLKCECWTFFFFPFLFSSLWLWGFGRVAMNFEGSGEFRWFMFSAGSTDMRKKQVSPVATVRGFADPANFTRIHQNPSKTHWNPPEPQIHRNPKAPNPQSPKRRKDKKEKNNYIKDNIIKKPTLLEEKPTLL